MYEVMDSYEICLETMALLPARKIEYDTIVVKENEMKYVRKTAFDLIDLACYQNDWTTYEGRRKAVIHHTNFVHKSPIPICIRKGIYFFPTHSPKNMDNIWLAFHQIQSIGKVPEEEKTKQTQSIVNFKNRLALKLDISFYTLEKQYNRTKKCIKLIVGEEGLRRILSW